MIIATQNPYDFEGTYLPENQLIVLHADRAGVPVGGGGDQRAVATPGGARCSNSPSPECSGRASAAGPSDHVKMDRTLTEYIVAFAASTRKRSELQVGLSPRVRWKLARPRATAVMSAGLRDPGGHHGERWRCAPCADTRYTPVHAAAIDHSEDADDRFPPLAAGDSDERAGVGRSRFEFRPHH